MTQFSLKQTCSKQRKGKKQEFGANKKGMHVLNSHSSKFCGPSLHRSWKKSRNGQKRDRKSKTTSKILIVWAVPFSFVQYPRLWCYQLSKWVSYQILSCSMPIVFTISHAIQCCSCTFDPSKLEKGQFMPNHWSIIGLGKICSV